MAFKLSISFAINLAANFGCNIFWITPDIVCNILRATIWSCCPVLFESEQTPFPRTCRWFRPAANMMFCLHIILLLRDKWLIERLSESMGCVGCCFGRQQLLAYSIEIFISHEKKWLVAAQNLQSIETLLTLELNQYRKSGRMFSSSEPVAASSDCSLLGKRPVFCACLSDPRKQSQRAAPRAWPLILPSEPSITFWNSLRRDYQMTGRGSNLDSNLDSAT